jgi:hypothetical protein
MARRTALLLAAILTILATLAIQVVGAAAAELPAPTEKNPPGDIPDSQVFVDYKGPSFTMKVPEGWSRTDQSDGAIFADKYNRISVSAISATSAPTAATITNSEAKTLESTGRAVKLATIRGIKLDGGKAVRLDYTANSDPNAVTNKQIRLEAVRFYLFGNGHLVVLDMSAPNGADNVDQWNLMANSLRVQ